MGVGAGTEGGRGREGGREVSLPVMEAAVRALGALFKHSSVTMQVREGGREGGRDG